MNEMNNFTAVTLVYLNNVTYCFTGKHIAARKLTEIVFIYLI